MIPEPDYKEEDNNRNNNRINSTTTTSSSARSGAQMVNKNNTNNTIGQQLPHFDEEGLVIPRKPVNPCLESTDRKSLHKEMLWNQKVYVFYELIKKY